MTITKLESILKDRGVKTLGVEHCSRLTDGMIFISCRVHVQVGRTYFNVVYEDRGGTYTFYPIARDIDTLINDINSALAS